MVMNAVYRGPQDCPLTIPLFPLPEALLLPRGEMPLNIFEPRYLAMVDDALAGRRVIGIIQPLKDEDPSPAPELYATGCIGRVTHFAETGDGRYLITLTGVARFRLTEELVVTTPYRQARVDYHPFGNDFCARAGEDDVNRDAVIAALEAFVKARGLRIDWRGVRSASNEALVNALSMMSPYGMREKQALLEAPDLKTRAEMLVAITEIELARGGAGSDPSLQ
ncbi:LON peptidase substrate-binding domain-containing protein [Camelimonas fluminis]|uniref:LON peptidase substrate-binding domain-containing protein n=1 Tax=Camelimonas fluminis TaxID=1576911 RepID=A0ABV7UIW6_9HYPH|nr:LON peptidase substrate-binding domain-containing protein [Camelimonas fluminis]